MVTDKYGKNFGHLFAAIATPFKEDFSVDEDALRKFLKYFMQPKFIDAGGGIIINPLVGEHYYLTRAEKRRNVEIAMEECGGKVPVFAGAGDFRTEDAAKVAKDVKEVGADGLFPQMPTGDGMVSRALDVDKYPEIPIDHLKVVIGAADLPAIVHTNPSAAKGQPVQGMLRILKELPNIIGWKMVYHYNDHLTIGRAFRGFERHIALLAAPANQFHAVLASGYFDGTLSGSFNYAMEPMVDHINAWRNQDLKEADRIWHKAGLDDLHEYVYRGWGRFHLRDKLGGWLRGLYPSYRSRPPMPKPRQEEVLTLRERLIGAGFDVIPEQEVKRILPQLLP